MTLSTEQEQKLIEQSLAGEVRAFNQLVETYQGMAFSVAYRLLARRGQRRGRPAR